MTIHEFSDQFDTMLDSYKYEDAFGKVDNNYKIKLDEYEKSVLLTEAQGLLLRAHFDVNFDNSEQGQIYFSNITVVADGVSLIEGTPYTSEGTMFTLPVDLLWILNERILDADGRKYTVVPINYKEYDRVASKPYAKPLKRQAWRLFQKPTVEGQAPISEIIMRTASNISKYIVRYIRKPKPIILEDLGDLTINGISTPSECELHSLTHFDILLKAVELAMSRYAPQQQEQRQATNEQ